MCSFTSTQHAILGFCTRQNFGNCWSLSNFKVVAVARQMWSQYLWLKQPKEAVDCAAPFGKKMSIANPISKAPPVKAQKDALNTGALDSQGNRLPPPYSMQVNNCMYADVEDCFIKTATMSIIGLKDLSGVAQPFQKHPLSFKKWDSLCAELCLLVGHDVNTRQMVVTISKNQQLKVLCYL